MRSSKKGVFVAESLRKSVRNARDNIDKGNKEIVIKTWSRRSTIITDFLNLTICVHNGKTMIPVHITEEHIGKKLGEFSPTRRFGVKNGGKHGGNKVAQRSIK